jgi:2-hydroxyacyl-CoA lyase 1
MAEIDGATIIAKSLKQQGVEYVFGIVGIPVTTIAGACQKEGMTYIGVRHEQAAAYAAQAISYMTGKMGVALVVSGPGMTNALTAFGNAWANCWPMLLIGGASDLSQRGMGAFQECPQVEIARPIAKWAQQETQIERIPAAIEAAIRTAMYGRPGPAYLDLPAELILGTVDEEKVQYPPPVPPAPRPMAGPAAVQGAITALKSAERPLVIVGKGAAWSQAEQAVQKFVDSTQLPYLASPMGKGVIADDHPLSVAAGRTYALQNADLVFLVGARLNWIMHFGLPPRFAENVRVVQLDIAPEEIGRNVPTEVALIGDIKAVIGQINEALEAEPWQFGKENDWRFGLKEAIEKNVSNTTAMYADDSVPMGYYRMLKELKEAMPRDAYVVSEGASTMDIGRQVLDNYLPRHRLDAGTWGTMGVGPGFALAAQVANPDKVVIDLEGDSAFGFDGLEVEVACRHNLPIVFVVANNNGIGGGPSEINRDRPLPPNSYVPNAHYERVIEAFGGDGYFCETPDDFRTALDTAIAARRPSLITVMLDPQARRRPQQFAWLTR